MNPDLHKLQSYPFEKLAKLKSDVTINNSLVPIALSIGEPKHAPPEFALQAMRMQLPKLSQYPVTQGLPELRQAIADWAIRRFGLPTNGLDANKQILPVNGTREALFSFAQAVVDRSKSPLVIIPNPFYQIYEGAAFLSGAEPFYLNLLEENHYQPDFSTISEDQWQRCQLIYLCSPSNPCGSVIDVQTYAELIELADKYNFIIASDECYSEIYPNDKPAPVGLLQACAALGRDDFERCIVFHSLSKRSNLPGLRSGFIAGDAAIVQRFLHYRTYHGCAMSLPAQHASVIAWQEEQHVVNNRSLYCEKFAQVRTILADAWSLQLPQAGFNFWAKTPIDDELFTKQLYQKTNITVLPGSYLSRNINGTNPGSNYVRMAMVPPLADCLEAAERIKHFVDSL